MLFENEARGKRRWNTAHLLRVPLVPYMYICSEEVSQSMEHRSLAARSSCVLRGYTFFDDNVYPKHSLQCEFLKSQKLRTCKVSSCDTRPCGFHVGPVTYPLASVVPRGLGSGSSSGVTVGLRERCLWPSFQIVSESRVTVLSYSFHAVFVIS